MHRGVWPRCETRLTCDEQVGFPLTGFASAGLWEAAPFHPVIVGLGTTPELL